MAASVAASAAPATTVSDARRKDATKNRGLLLAAAREALAEQPNPSLDAIAQAAGLTRRALYGHFPDRDALVNAVIEESTHTFALIGAHAVDDDPRLALAQLATGLWLASTTVRASVNIAANPQHHDAAAAAIGPLREKLAQLTRAGTSSGALRSDMTPERLALLIEEAAKAALGDGRITAGETAEVAIKVVLSVAGLSWREQIELIEAHPGVLAETIRP